MKSQKAKVRAVAETCPKCGGPHDSNEDAIVECPHCGAEGSTRCCNSGGRGCVCVQCEESE
jgi:hypothetical protein